MSAIFSHLLPKSDIRNRNERTKTGDKLFGRDIVWGGGSLIRVVLSHVPDTIFDDAKVHVADYSINSGADSDTKQNLLKTYEWNVDTQDKNFGYPCKHPNRNLSSLSKYLKNKYFVICVFESQ